MTADKHFSRVLNKQASSRRVSKWLLKMQNLLFLSLTPGAFVDRLVVFSWQEGGSSLLLLLSEVFV